VLYAGELLEQGPAREVFADPRHPYTVGLLRCIPRGGVRKDHGRLDTIPGFLPPIGADLPGCVFADRCALAADICQEQKPEASPVGGGRSPDVLNALNQAHIRSPRRKSHARRKDALHPDGPGHR